MPPRKRAAAKPAAAKEDTSQEEIPQEESTPIGDAVEKELVDSGKLHYDEVDVDAALARKTDDGKGEEDPGPSDWVSYATEGVEQEEEK